MTVTLLLTVVTQGGALYDHCPKTSYMQAADYGTITSLSFIFILLVEYTTVIYLIKVKISLPRQCCSFRQYVFYFKAPLGKEGMEWKDKKAAAIRIERYSCILLPLAFAFFCLVFWIVVLKYWLSEDHEEEGWQEMVSATKL